MLNRLTSTGFVTDLATMRDVLQELKSLSLKLQVSTCGCHEDTWGYVSERRKIIFDGENL